MLIHLGIPARNCLSRAIGLVRTLPFYSLVERQNLPISRICIESQAMLFSSKDIAPKFVINKSWVQLPFPQKCKAKRRKQYLPPLPIPLWCVHARVYVQVYETTYGIWCI